ncbi:bifunctional enoyl-CoA hydratase/phosphate acetyltransferase [Desulfovibrio ferrophilus]|uniref:Phosphate butyryltransferase n=1 Tax=Desulfovibrio ferrophilus TaxID=241368 RepID=A0A2Z6B120_9BACT|nr:bifunctional enoyl-CoA hydratase/phosphate acetyltransferase [Desulfovibrio ferrophilus]BBD09201.1 phosphate butyryltransferase [Desulfovibrio ferrophilus]
MPTIFSLDDIVREALPDGDLPRVAIARSANEFVLDSALQAFEAGLADPILIGDKAKTLAIAQRMGKDLSALRIIDLPDDVKAVREAVRLYREGEAQFIMKGLVSTAILLRAVLDKETGVPPEGILSHVSAFNAPHNGGRLMLLTDPGVNIRPNMQRKVDIVRNALHVARALGIEKPRVAMLAATEKVNYPAMPATLDADVISKMAAKGEFGDARIAGPMALDIALSPDAASCKNFGGEVAGCADILVTSDIESGNILYKSLNTLLGADMAGVVVGSRVPVVVPSRGDSAKSKFYSLALASYLSRKGGAA